MVYLLGYDFQGQKILEAKNDALKSPQFALLSRSVFFR